MPCAVVRERDRIRPSSSSRRASISTAAVPSMSAGPPRSAGPRPVAAGRAGDVGVLRLAHDGPGRRVSEICGVVLARVRRIENARQRDDPGAVPEEPRRGHPAPCVWSNPRRPSIRSGPSIRDGPLVRGVELRVGRAILLGHAARRGFALRRAGLDPCFGRGEFPALVTILRPRLPVGVPRPGAPLRTPSEYPGSIYGPRFHPLVPRSFHGSTVPRFTRRAHTESTRRDPRWKSTVPRFYGRRVTPGSSFAQAVAAPAPAPAVWLALNPGYGSTVFHGSTDATVHTRPGSPLRGAGGHGRRRRPPRARARRRCRGGRPARRPRRCRR